MALFKRNQRREPPPPRSNDPTPRPEAHAGAGGFQWSVATGDLLYVSSVRDTADTGAGDADDLRDFLSNGPIVEELGGTFRSIIQNADGAQLDVPGFNHKAVSLSPDLQAWATASFLSHSALGLPAEYDRSAVDGRNMLWNSEELLVAPLSQVMTGDVRGNLNSLGHYGHGVFAVSHLATNGGQRVAALEYVGGADRAAILSI